MQVYRRLLFRASNFTIVYHAEVAFVLKRDYDTIQRSYHRISSSELRVDRFVLILDMSLTENSHN